MRQIQISNPQQSDSLCIAEKKKEKRNCNEIYILLTVCLWYVEKENSNLRGCRKRMMSIIAVIFVAVIHS